MTQQMFGFGCDEVRKVAFDFRRGELPPEDHKRVELHLESCEQCTDYVSRVDGMLTATKQHDFARDIDRNALFDQIMARVDVEEEPETPQADVVNLSAFNRPAEDEEPIVASNDNRVRTYITAAAMLAAGILIGVFLPRLFQSPETTDEVPREIAKKEAPSPIEKKRVDAPPTILADLAHQPSPASAQNVVVYGDVDADWNVQGTVDQKMTLKSGTVLVEFVPTVKNAKFEVESDRFTIDVIGTVFYASKEKGLVGVVTGKVKVTPKEGEPVTLERGQEYIVGQGKKEADLAALNSAEVHVDVEAHELKLDAVKVAPKPTTRKYSPEVIETPRRKLRQSAESAVRDGRYAIAAEYYERMVEEFPATDPENASLRLDLARIYIRYLKEPRRALRHLRRFTKDRPRDSATPSAIEQMCRISKQIGTHEPQCAE